MHVVPVQQQKNNTGCGIYAIAFVYFIANTTHSSIVSLEEIRLKKHLYFRFQNCKMALFPLSSR